MHNSFSILTIDIKFRLGNTFITNVVADHRGHMNAFCYNAELGNENRFSLFVDTGFKEYHIGVVVYLQPNMWFVVLCKCSSYTSRSNIVITAPRNK